MSARLTIFAKGNVDLRDTLHSKWVDGNVVWNGINEVLLAQHPEWRARVRHETCTRSDALLAADGSIPLAIAERCLDFGAHPLASQFSSRLWDKGHDVVVLSLQPEVMNRLARDRTDHHLLYPEGAGTWSEDDRTWFTARYDAVGLLSPEQSMANLKLVFERLRGQVPHMLVYTLSPFIPGERLHSLAGMAETLAWRIRRFNLALIDLARELDFSIVDVETILARHGAERLKIDGIHITAEACRLIAEEVVFILGERGCFEA
jgi:hypothetical protein